MSYKAQQSDTDSTD